MQHFQIWTASHIDCTERLDALKESIHSTRKFDRIVYLSYSADFTEEFLRDALRDVRVVFSPHQKSQFQHLHQLYLDTVRESRDTTRIVVMMLDDDDYLIDEAELHRLVAGHDYKTYVSSEKSRAFFGHQTLQSVLSKQCDSMDMESDFSGTICGLHHISSFFAHEYAKRPPDFAYQDQAFLVHLQNIATREWSRSEYIARKMWDLDYQKPWVRFGSYPPFERPAQLSKKLAQHYYVKTTDPIILEQQKTFDALYAKLITMK